MVFMILACQIIYLALEGLLLRESHNVRKKILIYGIK